MPRSIPVLITLALIWAVFYSQSHFYLSFGNLTNLTLQIVTTAILSLGIVFVLLVGEIDLSSAALSRRLRDGRRHVRRHPRDAAGRRHRGRGGLRHARDVHRGPGHLVRGAVAHRDPRRHGDPAGTDPRRAPRGVHDQHRRHRWPCSPARRSLPGARLRSRHARLARCSRATALFQHRERTSTGSVGPPSSATSSCRSVVAAVACSRVVFVLSRQRGLPLPVLILAVMLLVAWYATTQTRYGTTCTPRRRPRGRPAGRHPGAPDGALLLPRARRLRRRRGHGRLLTAARGLGLLGRRAAHAQRDRRRRRRGHQPLRWAWLVWSALLGALVIGSISNGVQLLGLSTEVQFFATGVVLIAGRGGRRRAHPRVAPAGAR